MLRGTAERRLTSGHGREARAVLGQPDAPLGLLCIIWLSLGKMEDSLRHLDVNSFIPM